MRNIVIGYDGSESADRALARVPDLAGEGGRVHLVAAIHRLAGKGGMSFDPIEKEQHDVDLEHAKARLAESGSKLTYRRASEIPRRSSPRWQTRSERISS